MRRRRNRGSPHSSSSKLRSIIREEVNKAFLKRALKAVYNGRKDLVSVEKQVEEATMKTNIRNHIRETLIQELGNTTEAYPFKFHRDEVNSKSFFVNYTFQTDKGTSYKVFLEYYYTGVKGFVYVDFSANGSTSDTVDEGTTFKAISTVISCLSDFWDRRFEILVDHPGGNLDSQIFQDIRGFKFIVAKADRGIENTQRFKLYKAFIDRQFKHAKLQMKGSKAYVIP